MRKFRKSRLQKIEEKRTLRQAIIFFVLTVVLILAVFFLGIPLVIKLAVFLGERRTPSRYNESQLLPPSQPRLQPLPHATNSALFSLAGFAPAGTKVKIYLNNALLKETITDKEGEFSARNLNLKEGENKIKVVSIVENKESEPYTTKVLYKEMPPFLEITSPQVKASFFEEEKELKVEGKTDPGAVVFVNNHFAIVDSQGNFSLNLNLNEGENQIKVVAQDEAGNQAELERTVTYTP